MRTIFMTPKQRLERLHGQFILWLLFKTSTKYLLCAFPKPEPGFPTWHTIVILCRVSYGEKLLLVLLILVDLLTIISWFDQVKPVMLVIFKTTKYAGCFLLASKQSFPHSWFITRYVTRLTRQVPLLVQELLTLPEHLSSPRDCCGVLVARS